MQFLQCDRAVDTAETFNFFGSFCSFLRKTAGAVVACIGVVTTPSPERQRTLALQERVFSFACGVLLACPSTIAHLGAREVWRNLVRAAPSASNNLEEADEASSTADFIAKMKIALREAKESRRGLRFLIRCKLTGSNYQALDALEDEARQIALIFAAIIIKVKARHKEERQRDKRQRNSRTE